MRPQTTSAPPPVVFGRDGDLEMIRSMLRDTPDDEPSSSKTKCYSVIGIHGIPGSGKTTLAQYVCANEREDSYFNLVMWIRVSQNFSVDTVFTEMIEIASGCKTDQLSNLDMLQMKLEAELTGKKFLLVLDDVWYDKDVSEQQLDLLLSPLKAGNRGSKVLVTTRFADAGRALGAQNLVPIREMDEEQYVSMFMHYALDAAAISDQALLREHECIGRKIAEKLGGSPLAARTVAGQLRRRLDIDFWRRSLNRDLLNHTMGALWWSYQQLEEHVRQCFTYCSMFPRRYELNRDELVHLWIAQGFVETTNGTEDMEDVGHDYFHVLLSRSFISIGNNTTSSGNFTIHDLLHDLAGRVAGSDCFRIEKGMVCQIPRDVRHLFIESYDREVFTDQILKLETLRTLFMSYSYRSNGMAAEDLEDLLKALKKLRVAHVNFRHKEKVLLPARIGEMKHLRCIFVSGYWIRVILPPAFGKLYHLQKFDALNCCFGYSTDKEMSNLVNLRYIHTMNKLEFPNIGRLTLLRTLDSFTVRKEAGYEIQQLEHLNNLRGHLIIYGLEAVQSEEEARQAKLADKVHISDLELEWCFSHQSSNLLVENKEEGRTCDQSGDPPDKILEALCPPFLVTSLCIRNYSGSTYPSWLSGEQRTLENLQHLHFSYCNGSDAPPKLELCVYLRTLSVLNCSWNSLPDNMENLTSLEELNIMSCKNILSLPRLPMSLERLSLDGWNGSDAPPRVGEFLVNLHRLQISSCSWNSLPKNMEQLTSLEELAIDSCENILSLPRLPRSIKKFQLVGCNSSLSESCRTGGHPNWEKIAHIPEDFKFIG
ncbi:putative disease resistance RPP13-like protein 1 isoform X2 [Phragmites australis]|nr:putative disease resistance RPP13-like protein 1 isoform X2 [Phragmites australis]